MLAAKLLAFATLLTPQVRADEYAEITNRLCDACEDIWLRAFPPADTANNTKAVERVQRGVAEKLSLLIHSFYG